MTLKFGVMMLKILRLTGINFKIYSNRELLFLIVIIFHSITVFIIFFIKKFSLGEHKICNIMYTACKYRLFIYGVLFFRTKL